MQGASYMDCEEVNWSGTSGLMKCPNGHFLSGRYREGLLADNATEIVKANCGKPPGPDSWGACHNQDLFTAPGAMSSCSVQDGEPSSMVGLVKTKAESSPAAHPSSWMTLYASGSYGLTQLSKEGFNHAFRQGYHTTDASIIRRKCDDCDEHLKEVYLVTKEGVDAWDA